MRYRFVTVDGAEQEASIAPMPAAFPELARSLLGRPLNKAKARAVAQEAAAALEPDSDTHASAAYRRHLAGVLISRVLLEAYDAARSVQ